MKAELQRYGGMTSNGANAKRQSGRATTFTEDKAVAVLERLIEGATTEEACKDEGIPVSTWYVWRSVVPGLLEACSQAYEMQADSQIDQADKMLRDVDITTIDPKLANAALRKVQQIADYRFNLAKCRNFKMYGDKKAQLNMNVNANVTDEDISKWFNK
jgi:hypothetical protein